MAKHLEYLKNEFNLSYKNTNTLYGVVDGYEISIHSPRVSNEGLIVYLNFFGHGSLKEDLVNKFIDYEGKSMAKGSITEYGIRLTLNGWTYNSAAKKLTSKLRYVLSTLKARGVLGITHSPLNGKELTNKTIMEYKEGFVTLEKETVDQIHSDFKRQQEEYKAAPNNYLKGFVGSLVGALGGAIGFVILYFIGFISSWIGVLSVFLSGLLYKVFGGKETIVTYLVSGVISLAVIMITAVIVCRMDIQLALVSEGIDISVQEALNRSKEIREVYNYNIIMTAVYTILGVVLQVIYSARRLNKK